MLGSKIYCSGWKNSDSLGQVKRGAKFFSDRYPVPGQQFEYAHDDIGNRRTARAGGDENGANLRSASYSPNNLNQYTSREVPGAVDVLGLAMGDNTSLTVNSAAPWRKGEYFRKEVSVTNSSVAVWQAIAVAATGETTVNGNVFVPKTPENFTYEDDGNLTQDGRWDYTWDAENRLVKLVSKSGAPSGSEKAVAFTHDGKSRRISKTVSNWVSGAWQFESTNRFVYDGWNLIAVLTSSSAIQSAFVWGLDLSGTLQGAGGVGGLLMVTNSGNGAHFCAYDGNGNVAALVKASDGTMSANYEYGPFGEALRVTGTMGKANPFRFSTKYQDDESDFLYYGYRSYNPNTGRWLNRDPINELGFQILTHNRRPLNRGAEKNLFGFVQNDPLDSYDLLGLVESSLTPDEEKSCKDNIERALNILRNALKGKCANCDSFFKRSPRCKNALVKCL